MTIQEQVDYPARIAALAKLREPFPEHQISKLPKKNMKTGATIFLSYVGHAALTDRLLDVDPEWHWEPLALDKDGLPLYDSEGGMWIKLTICGVTRLGYGDAGDKKGPNAIKELIGDALRNAAMRFGCALDLWHKGDLHLDEPDEAKPERAEAPRRRKPAAASSTEPRPAAANAGSATADRPGNTIQNPDDAPLPVDFTTIMQGMARAASIDSLQRWSGEVKLLTKKPNEKDLDELRDAYRDRDHLLRAICARVSKLEFEQREREPMPSPEQALADARERCWEIVDEGPSDVPSFSLKEYRDLRPGVTDQRLPDALTIEECKQVLDLVMKGYQSKP